MILGIPAGRNSPDTSGEFVPPALSQLKLWYSADKDVFTDTSLATRAGNGDRVARWGNKVASGEEAIQSIVDRRLTLRTGGLNGKPYLEGDWSQETHFEDLTSIPFAGGLAVDNRYACAMVIENVDLTNFPSIFGHTEIAGGKAGLYFRPISNEQVHWYKAQTRRGNLATGANMVIVQKDANPGNFRWSLNRTYQFFSENTNASSGGVTNVQFLRNTGNAAGGYFDGRIYELMFWTEQLSQANFEAIEDYFSAKYNIFP